MISRILISAAAALTLSACATIPEIAPASSPEPVTVRIIGINDFHGNLEPLRSASKLTMPDGSEEYVPVGGAAYLATAINQRRAKSEHSLVISAGDLISASPLVSSLFLDEPTIGAMNRIGLTFNAVGNHEFDRGAQELLRMQDGGCEKYTLRDPCRVEQFTGAEFGFLAANVTKEDGATLFPPFGIQRFGSGPGEVAIGVIGLTLEDTPGIVTPSGIAGLTFSDEADAINALIPQLKAQGVDAVVVAIHQGLNNDGGYNDQTCGALSGSLMEILDRLDPQVDLVISGHTHQAYICDYSQVDPRHSMLVTSAGSAGAMLTDITLTIDPALGKVIARGADNVPVQSPRFDDAGAQLPANAAFPLVSADAEIAAYVARYAAAAKSESSRPVGKISASAERRGGDSPLGSLIADAQLEGTRSAGAQIAMMNSGGIRASLVAVPDGSITYGDIYSVQPFGNTLVTKSFAGAQVLALLEQQFAADGRISLLSVSNGFAVQYDPTRPLGEKIVAAMLDGQPIDPAATYRVTMNSFLASGGDGFSIFDEGTDAIIGPVDLDAMEEYLRAVPARDLPEAGRIIEIK